MREEADRNPFNYPYRSMTDFSDELYRPQLGRELEIVPLGIGPTIEVRVSGNYIYSLSGSTLIIIDARSFEVVGRLGGLVSARQIGVAGDVAMVTARESGCYVVDVSDPANPRLLAQYDPVEFATGVHMTRPDLAILSCRHYGLEFVDLTHPESPRYLSHILVGEAQSVACVGNVAYAGVWFEKELVVVDFDDPTKPKIIGRSALDGFGDGVAVKDGLAYIATGHHSALQRDPRHFEPARHITLDMLETGYGKGHGVEIHDVSDPTAPRLVRRMKSPPTFVNSPDTWRVILHDGLLIHADAENGVFIHDAADPVNPTPLAFGVLPAFSSHRELPTVSMQEDRHPVTGIAMVGDTLLLASAASDLYRCVLPTRDAPVQRIVRSPYPEVMPEPDVPVATGGDVLLDTGAQVHSVASDGEYVFAAAGTDGLYLLDAQSGAVVAQETCPGITQHVWLGRGLVYTSHGTGGMRVWKRDGASLRQVGAWRHDASIRQLMIPEAPHLGIAVAGGGAFLTLDLTDPAAPRQVADHRVRGLVYARLLADQLVGGRYAVGASQGGGLNWFDLSGGDGASRQPTSPGSRLCPIVEGITVHRGKALVIQAGGYYSATPDVLQTHDEATHIREPGRYFSGSPQSLGDDLLAVTNRATGSTRILDVSDAEAPRTLSYLHLPGNPDRPIRVGKRLIFPCGRAGLRAIACP
jgi:hypothetical protein